MKLEDKIYYVYSHTRLDTNEIFYIGIGSQKKHLIYYKRANAIYNRNKLWKNIINKTDYKIEILLISENRDEVLNEEIRLISLYGKIINNTGKLANMSDGGEFSALGSKISEEHKQKISLSSKGRIASNETRLKMSLAQKGRKISLAGIKNMSKAQRGRKAHNKRAVLQYDSENNFIKEYNSLLEASKETGIDVSTICTICKGRRKSIHKTKWKYKLTENV